MKLRRSWRRLRKAIARRATRNRSYAMTFNAVPNRVYTLEGRCYSRVAAHPKAGVAVVTFIDAGGAPIAGPYQGLSYSERTGCYRYVAAGRPEAPERFTLKVTAPEGAARAHLVVRPWRKDPIVLPQDPVWRELGSPGILHQPKCESSDLKAAIALVDEQFGSLPYMTTTQALSLGTLVQREGLNSLLELGTYHGKSTAYMAAVLEALGRGILVTIDRVDAEAKNPNVYQILRCLELSHRVQVYLEPRSLTWRLMRLIEEHERPCFDFCYFDGGHSWDVTGYAFFLVDRLLKPGGWVIFDDLDWTYEQMIKPGEPLPDFLSDVPEEERRTAQVRKVWDLLVGRSNGYERHEVIGNWGVARKRSFSA